MYFVTEKSWKVKKVELAFPEWVVRDSMRKLKNRKYNNYV